MLLAHALTLAEAGTYVAAPAEQAHTVDASAGYQQVLLRLDALYGGDVPALAGIRLDDPNVFFTAAESAIEDLLHRSGRVTAHKCPLNGSGPCLPPPMRTPTRPWPACSWS
jgi:hypothetical protein